MRAGIKSHTIGVEIEAVGDKPVCLYTDDTVKGSEGAVKCIAIVTDPSASRPDHKVRLNPFGNVDPADMGETVATIGDPCTMLPVCYVVDSDIIDDVTAYFPTMDTGGRYITCYQHIGQHSAASPGYLEECRQATPVEYADLHTQS